MNRLKPEDSIYRFLDTNGDGTGTTNANGDYSGAADEFYLEPSKPCEIHRMLISIGDAAGMSASDYGNITGGLTNGWRIWVEGSSGSESCDLMGGLKIKTNAEIGRHCYDVDVKTWSTGPELLVARWTFAKSGSPVILTNGARLVLTLNDDFTPLTDHYFCVQGFYF